MVTAPYLICGCHFGIVHLVNISLGILIKKLIQNNIEFTLTYNFYRSIYHLTSSKLKADLIHYCWKSIFSRPKKRDFYFGNPAAFYYAEENCLIFTSWLIGPNKHNNHRTMKCLINKCLQRKLNMKVSGCLAEQTSAHGPLKIAFSLISG